MKRLLHGLIKSDLKARLVYFRVKEKSFSSVNEYRSNSLLNKIMIKPDSEFYAWIERELHRKFDYSCCEDLAEFRKEHQSLTLTGPNQE